MWLAVAGQDARAAQALLDEQYLSLIDEHARRSATMVIDITSATRTCPACFAEYAAGPTSCPECGLRIGA